MTKYQEDRSVRDNLARIIESHPDILRPEIKVTIERDRLCQDIADLIRRLPLTEQQGRVLYEAISGRYKNKTCFKCLKLRCELGGRYVFPDGDMSKPKRFICEDCV